jgi:hypothetical protein
MKTSFVLLLLVTVQGLCSAQSQQNSPATPDPNLVPPLTGSLRGNNSADSPSGSASLDGVPVRPLSQSPAIMQAICDAISEVGTFPVWGSQAQNDLLLLKETGHIVTTPRHVPWLGLTVPDYDYDPSPAHFDEWPILVPDWFNWIVMPENDFEGGGGGGGGGPAPAVHRFGKKGLAILLFHEWRHAQQRLVPWDKNYNRDRFKKCDLMAHIASHQEDQALICACLPMLSGDERERLEAMKKMNENNITTYQGNLVAVCRRIQ